MTTIIKYDASMSARWDEFVKASRNSTFLHQRGYMDYHSDRFEDCSLVAVHNDKWCAVLPACIDSDTLYSHRGLTYGSWLLPLKHFDPVMMLEVMDAAMAWMRAPIDLSCPLALDRGNKSGANAARKAGIKVGPSDDWSGYWHLLETLLDERYDTRPVHTLAEIDLLRERFPDNIKLYTATLDGELLAGVVMYLSKPVAHSQYIGSSPQGKERKALTLLFDYLIGEYGQQGYRYFDFGISNEDHGRYLNEGLVRQKFRLGGRGIVYNTYEVLL